MSLLTIIKIKKDKNKNKKIVKPVIIERVILFIIVNIKKGRIIFFPIIVNKY